MSKFKRTSTRILPGYVLPAFVPHLPCQKQIHSSVVLRVRLPEVYGNCGQCIRRFAADEVKLPLSHRTRVLQRGKRPGRHFKQPVSCVEKLGAEACGANISIRSGRVLLPLQSLQSLPARTACLPLSQIRQLRAAELGANLPAGHAVQAAAPTSAKWPGRHWLHDFAATMFEACPATQVAHMVERA